MSQDLAANKLAVPGKTDLFAQARPVLLSVAPGDDFIDPNLLLARLDELKACFESDLRRVTEVSELLYRDDITAYGARTANVFSRWEEEGGAPSLTAMIVSALEHFGIDSADVAARAAFVAAILAELPNGLQYHGNEHYRKVLFHGIRMIAAHNAIYAGTGRAFDRRQIGILLVASCIHDLGHEGGDNLRDGVYTPGYMEQRAFDIANPYLEEAGLDEEALEEIQALVFTTDITFLAGDNSPCVRLKKIYRHYFCEGDTEDVSLIMMGKLRRFDENPALVEMAMILHEADIGSSAGLSYEQTIKETVNIMEERGLDTASPRTVLAFLREQLGETLFTEAGRRLFGPVMTVVIEEAEKDLLSGRETYYDS